ncbi:P-loop NTPase fold protein [Actinoplanes sp. NPDC048988]|uniref:P-loop NTPase fold protein n=1 Tax=Actinoplanes sp. NPDC048988 TaxID=3363901 RepID=UPI00371B5101
MTVRGSGDVTPPPLAESLAVNDAASADDHLGFARFAVPLAEYIAGMRPSQTPWTVGVYGEWGSGKTSFLKQVSAELTDRGIEPVWFNAWKYAREQDLWKALIQTVLDRVRVTGPWPRRVWVKSRIWFRSLDVRSGLLDLSRKLLVLLFRVGLIALGIYMAASVFGPSTNPAVSKALQGLPWLQDILSAPWARAAVAVGATLAAKPESLFKLFDIRLGFDLAAFQKRRSYREQVAFLEEFSADFRDIIRIVCRDRPLVVVIDDLDRCLPEQTLQIVETMKLFLDVEGCVFLVAVDRDIIENAVSVKYKDLAAYEGLLRRVSETYFEKIVQLPFSLPPVTAQALDNLVRAVSNDEDVHRCLPILRGSPPYNPRRIKRVVQTFTLIKSLAASVWQDSSPVPSLLAKIVVIQARYRDVYGAVVDDPELLPTLERIYRAAGDAGAGAPADARQALDLERARVFQTRYPDLPALFRQELTADDSFAGVSAGDYLSFVRAVVPGDPAADTQADSGVPSFAIWHVRDDIAWAEWIARQLSDAGYPAQFAGPGQPPPSAEPAYVIVVLSRLAAETIPAQEWATVRAGGSQVIVAKVGPLSVPQLLAGQRVVAVEGLAEREARALLLSALEPRHRRPADLAGGARADTGDSPSYPGHGLRLTNVWQPAVGRLVERGQVHAELEHRLLEMRREDVPTVCALIGMPGAGKTEVVREYARRHGDEYQVVWWIDGTSAATVEQGLRDLAAELGAPSRTGADTVALITDHLSRYRRWLLIIDDATDPDTIRQYLPLSGRGDVLVTSRRRGWSGSAPYVGVEPLTPDEAVEFLATRLPSEPAGELAGLAALLGHLPSALDAAVDYLRFTSVSVGEFRARLDSDERWFIQRGDLARNLTLDTAGIGELAFVAPRPFPRSLVALSEESLGTLQEHSLAVLRTGTVEVHALVQSAARSGLSPERAHGLVSAALTAVAGRLEEFGVDPDEGTVTDHLHALTTHAARLGTPGDELHAVLVGAARQLVALGSPVHAGRVARSAADRPGASPAQRQEGRVVLAEALMELGRADAAIPLLDNLDLDRDLLVRAYISVGNLKAARTLQNRPGGRTDLAGMVNVAGINRVGSPRVARQVLAPTLAQYRAGHPDDALVGRALGTLAGVALQLDDRDEARRLYEEALAVQRLVLRPGHPDIAETLRAYAAVLASLSELEPARDSLREAADIWRSIVGPHDLLVTSVRNQLAGVLSELGEDHQQIPHQYVNDTGVTSVSPVDRLIVTSQP